MEILKDVSEECSQEQQLFKKLEKNLQEISEEYEIDKHISMFLIKGIWNIKINGTQFSGTDLEEILRRVIDYFNLSNFRNIEKGEWI